MYHSYSTLTGSYVKSRSRNVVPEPRWITSHIFPCRDEYRVPVRIKKGSAIDGVSVQKMSFPLEW